MKGSFACVAERLAEIMLGTGCRSPGLVSKADPRLAVQPGGHDALSVVAAAQVNDVAVTRFGRNQRQQDPGADIQLAAGKYAGEVVQQQGRWLGRIARI